MRDKTCPYAKSDMTPCVIRDGDICYAMGSYDNPICVGCELTPEQTGVPEPKDWAGQCAEYRRESERRSRRQRGKG
jgi:hypothetical protein